VAVGIEREELEFWMNWEFLRRRDNRHECRAFVIFIPHGPVNDPHPCPSSSIDLCPEKVTPIALVGVESPFTAR
jgi:hypothetical protein